MPSQNNRLGLRREDKNVWEKRTPLTPQHIRLLHDEYGIETSVQTSPIRVFQDKQYEEAGGIIREDLSDCDIVFGVKEIPATLLKPGVTYLFFSHTIKGQAQNMALLERIMDLGCSLIDYEKVADDQGKRLLFFGRYAGLAGMLDTLWALGQRFANESIATPFSSLDQTHRYGSLKDAREAVQAVGERIRAHGLDDRIVPLICGFAGYGHVSNGAQEIFDCMPHREISPEALMSFNPPRDEAAHTLYKVIFHEEHLVERRDENRDTVRIENRNGKQDAGRNNNDAFDLQEYYTHPERYESVFHRYLPALTCLLNGIYWTPAYPRLITRSQIQSLFASRSAPRLRLIGDITCDIEGAIELTVKTTTPDRPVFCFNPRNGSVADECGSNGITIMAVDNLPCELPRASSKYFSQRLLPFVPAIVRCDYTKSYDALDLPPEIKRAMIVHRGRLTPPYRYLSDALQKAREGLD